MITKTNLPITCVSLFCALLSTKVKSKAFEPKIVCIEIVLPFRSKKQRGGGGGFRGAISSLMCTFKNALGGNGGGNGGHGAAGSNNNSGGGVRSTIRNSSSGN